jgi:hypothetical protein
LSIAHLNIEDVEDGTYNVQAVYRCCERSGTDLCFCAIKGFNAEKRSHVAVALLMKHLDTLGERLPASQQTFVEQINDSKSVIVTDRSLRARRRGKRFQV